MYRNHQRTVGRHSCRKVVHRFPVLQVENGEHDPDSQDVVGRSDHIGFPVLVSEVGQQEYQDADGPQDVVVNRIPKLTLDGIGYHVDHEKALNHDVDVLETLELVVLVVLLLLVTLLLQQLLLVLLHVFVVLVELLHVLVRRDRRISKRPIRIWNVIGLSWIHRLHRLQLNVLIVELKGRAMGQVLQLAVISLYLQVQLGRLLSRDA